MSGGISPWPSKAPDPLRPHLPTGNPVISREPTAPNCCPHPPTPPAVLRQPRGCPGDRGCLALTEGLRPQAAPHLHLLWEPVAELLEAAQAVRWLGAGRKKRRGRGDLRSCPAGMEKSPGVVPDLAERGLVSACLGGCPLKWLSWARAARKTVALESLVFCTLVLRSLIS